METIHLEVSGRVQGVGFRWFVVEKARELRLAGWVKNRPDGAQVKHVRKLPTIAPESLHAPFTIVR